MPKVKKERYHEDSYFYHAGFHVHVSKKLGFFVLERNQTTKPKAKPVIVQRLTIAISICGCFLSAFPLIYMTTRHYLHLDIARVVSAVITLICNLLLYWGNTKQIRWMYWPYLIIHVNNLKTSHF
jgi:membrane protein YdbS with pleckstrin-like domain